MSIYVYLCLFMSIYVYLSLFKSIYIYEKDMFAVAPIGGTLWHSVICGVVSVLLVPPSGYLVVFATCLWYGV